MTRRSSRSRPTNGGSSPSRAAAPADAGGDAQRAPERDLLRLALQLEGAGVLVHDGGLARAPCRLADEHGARLGRRLDARRGVDEVAGDESLAGGAERHGGLAGEDARACLQPGVERGDGLDEIERGADGALGVVLARGRRAPHRHHRVADELLHGAAVAADDEARGVEVAREQVADVLRVARLRERREADEVGEEDGDDAPLDVGAAAAAGSAATSDVPHSPQKRWPGSYAAPQLGQAVASEAPQFLQNFCPSRLSVPQLVHWATSGA